MSRLNIKSLKSSLKKSATPYIEKNVLIGSKYKFPVRLIISGIDDQERKRREYKQIKKSKDRKRGKVNQEVLSSKSLNLFITNISEEDVSADKVYKYGTSGKKIMELLPQGSIDNQLLIN